MNRTILETPTKSFVVGIDMASGKDLTVTLNVVPSMMINNTEHEKVIAEQICSITTLAVLNASVLHIDIEYTPWLSSFSVKVFEVTTDYMKAHPNHFRRTVLLERPDAINRLKDLEDLLIDKVGEAKDKLMGAV